MSVTLAELRTACRDDADMANSGFVDDSEIDRRINHAIKRLYEMLVIARGADYYRTSATITTTAGVATSSQPATLLQLLGLDVTLGGTVVEIDRLDWARRNDFQNVQGWSGSGIYYLPEGASLRWFPTPDAAHSVTCWHIPQAITLVNAADTFDAIHGFEDWVIADVAVRMLAKEESDTSAEAAIKMDVERRIQAMIPARDAKPLRPADVRRRFSSQYGPDGWEEC